MKKKWLVATKKTDDLFKQVLKNRKIKNPKRILEPDFSRDISDPFEIVDMKKAVRVFQKALEEKKRVAIFADYDADGIPGAAILTTTMRFLKTEPALIIIPDREDGYGLKEKNLAKIIKEKIDLLITIDCGITSVSEINFLRQKNIEVIVIDHHLAKVKLPNASAIIDPYPPHFSAAGLVWKFCQAVLKNNPSASSGQENNENFLKWLLDLVAISTICDMVPLTDENWTLAHFGLKVLQKNKRYNLRKLFDEAGIAPEKIDAYIVGFQIGPRINAASRVATPRLALKLLISEDKTEVREIANKLNAVNVQRQNDLKKALEEAEEIIEKEKLNENKIILLANKNWSLGILGLIASQIKDKFYRPAIVLQLGKKVTRGSARSISAFHLVKNLAKLKKDLVSFGGHAKAAGLEIETKKIKIFYKNLLLIADKILTEKDLIPKIKIDAEVENLKKINLELLAKINKLEPYGMENPKPVFLFKNVLIKYADKVGKDKNHLKLTLEKDGEIIKAIFFNDSSELKSGDKINIVFNLALNDFGGIKKVELNILDAKII